MKIVAQEIGESSSKTSASPVFLGDSSVCRVQISWSDETK